MLRFFIVHLCVSLAFLPKSFSQTVHVYALTDQSPIENVAVFNNEKGFSSFTDKKGEVNIIGLADNDLLQFQHPSFYLESISLKKLKNQHYKIYLIDKIIYIDETVIAVNKSEEKNVNVSNNVDVIRPIEIALTNPQTSADMLSKSGNVFVQKSQAGGGSPSIRGFEANKVLIVVDGIRMNNAIYRGGHLQNVITVDNHSLERAEVIFGPGSLIYGSDALGGVMHFYTKSPKLSVDDEINFSAHYTVRYASANHEKTGHFDMNIGTGSFGSFTGITLSDFNDVRAGANRKDYYGDWGLNRFFVRRIGKVDSVIANENTVVQKFTGYQQIDFTQKFLYQPSDAVDITFNIQYSTSSNIPRYDRLQEMAGGQPKYAVWHYGPQNRLLAAMQLNNKNQNKLYDRSTLVVGFQNIDEERVSRRLHENDETNRNEDVIVLSANYDLSKIINERNNLLYGLEYTFNNVQSTAFERDIETGLKEPASTRYPDGGSHMHTAAVYVKHRFQINDRLFYSQGLRYNYIYLLSRFDETSFFDFPFDDIKISASAITGLADIVYNPNDKWHLNFLFSTGFRTPNVDDVGKVFDPAPNVVVVPNSDLKPEYAYNLEMGISRKFKESVKISATGYFMFISNLIDRAPALFNESDSIIYEGTFSQVYANSNIGKAFITGFTINFRADINDVVSLRSDLNYVYGKDRTNNAPLAHIPPIFGKTALSVRKEKFTGEVYILYNGWKQLDQYSPNPTDNLDLATEFGTPGWFTLNFNATYRLYKYLQLQFGIENMLDSHYRTFASGVSSAGINIKAGLRGSF